MLRLVRTAAFTVLLASPLAFGQVPPRFPNPETQTGKFPSDIAVADLDHDGKLDAVARNAGSDDVTVLRGDGMGRLAVVQHVPTGDEPSAHLLADFDGDGHVDCLVTNFGTGDVVLLAGSGTGSLTARTPLPLGLQPTSLATADVDLDGDIDAFAANPASLLKLTSNGTSGFAVSTVVTGSQSAFAVGDVTGDGNPDLMRTPLSPLRLQTLKGDGAGGFSFLSNAGINGTIASVVALGDIDSDGDRDAAVGLLWDSNLTILRNAGGGTFVQQIQLLWGSPERTIITDETGDGAIDLVVFGPENFLWRGSGVGNFADIESRPPIGLGVLADMNADGQLDYVGADTQVDSSFGRVAVSMRDELGRWQTWHDNTFALCNALIDIDQDGDLDAVDGNAGGFVLTNFNDGLGNFTPGPTSAFPSIGVPDHPVAGDFNGDGLDDVVTTSSFELLTTLFGDGVGGFSNGVSTQLSTPPSGFDYRSLIVSDLDQDGSLDLAIERAAQKFDVTAYHGLGNGAFVAQGTVSFESSVAYTTDPFTVADLDANGFGDLVACDSTAAFALGGRVRVALGNATTTWQAPSTIVVGGLAGFHARCSDFDGDGNLDVATVFGSATGSHARTKLAVLLGNGTGALAPAMIHDTGPHFPYSLELALADFDADGDDDAAIAHGQLSSNSIVRNQGGSFTVTERYGGYGLFFDLHAADLDGDASPDLIGFAGKPLLSRHATQPCAGGFAEFGSGCFGHSYFVPHLAGFGCASPGQTFALVIDTAPPATNGILFLGGSPASLPLGYGCLFLVAPVGMQALSVPVSGSGLAGGYAKIFGELPTAFPIGYSVYSQVFVPTPDVTWGYASSNGLRIDVQ